MTLDSLFDVYSRRARLQPAMMALLPAILSALPWLPSFASYWQLALPVIVGAGVLFLLAQGARQFGLAAEERFLREWGNWPSVLLLRHRDSTLGPYDKRRYHDNLAVLYPGGWRAPTAEEEAADPGDADARYRAAGQWLVSMTRDTKRFRLLFRDNIAYGFARNLYGLKSIGVTIAVAGALANAAAWWWLHEELSRRAQAGVIACAIACLLALGCWCVLVTPQSVRTAANAYAMRLLSASDELRAAASGG